MATNTVVSSVAGIRMFPVISMRGERLEQGEFTERGLVGDRAYVLIDADTGKVASAKSVRLFPDLFGCSAVFVEPPQLDGELPLLDEAVVQSTKGAGFIFYLDLFRAYVVCHLNVSQPGKCMRRHFQTSSWTPRIQRGSFRLD